MDNQRHTSNVSLASHANEAEGVRRVRSYTDSLRPFSGVGVRITPTFTPPSISFRELDGRRKSLAPEQIWASNLPQHHSPTLRTPPTLDLLRYHPLRAPLSQVLALENQTLMNRKGQRVLQ